jgi:hypothetical protein
MSGNCRQAGNDTPHIERGRGGRRATATKTPGVATGLASTTQGDVYGAEARRDISQGRGCRCHRVPASRNAARRKQSTGFDRMSAISVVPGVTSSGVEVGLGSTDAATYHSLNVARLLGLATVPPCHRLPLLLRTRSHIE